MKNIRKEDVNNPFQQKGLNFLNKLHIKRHINERCFFTINHEIDSKQFLKKHKWERDRKYACDASAKSL